MCALRGPAVGRCPHEEGLGDDAAEGSDCWIQSMDTGDEVCRFTGVVMASSPSALVSTFAHSQTLSPWRTDRPERQSGHSDASRAAYTFQRAAKRGAVPVAYPSVVTAPASASTRRAPDGHGGRRPTWPRKSFYADPEEGDAEGHFIKDQEMERVRQVPQHDDADYSTMVKMARAIMVGERSEEFVDELVRRTSEIARRIRTMRNLRWGANIYLRLDSKKEENGFIVSIMGTLLRYTTNGPRPTRIALDMDEFPSPELAEALRSTGARYIDFYPPMDDAVAAGVTVVQSRQLHRNWPDKKPVRPESKDVTTGARIIVAALTAAISHAGKLQRSGGDGVHFIEQYFTLSS